MWKRLIWLIMALSMWGTTQAQSIAWAVWIYEPQTGQMTMVDDGGGIVDYFFLALPTGVDRYPEQVAVNRDGTLFAYVPYNSTTYQASLVVSQRERMMAQYNLPLTFADSTEFIADETLFDDTTSRVALGYSLDGGGWEIVALNIVTNAIDYALRYDSPNVAILGLSADVGVTPVIRQFAGGVISFNLIRAGTEASGEATGYDWLVNSGDLRLNAMYASLDADRLSITGEVVMSLADSRLANQSASFPFSQSNTLQVYVASSGARFPFFNAASATLQSPRFIQNGELILSQSIDSSGQRSGIVIRRNGALVGNLPNVVDMVDAKGLADGFIYLTDSFAPGSRTLVYVNTRDGLDAGIPLWVGSAGTSGLLAWVGDNSFNAQSDYEGWTQLAPPVYAVGGAQTIAPAPNQPLLVSPAQAASDSATPVFQRVLAVGSLAVINTTGGDQLNVRSGPGTNYQIVAKLGSGAQVTLMEGPTGGDGFTWWKIRTGSGISGWVVESVDDNGIRLQTLVPQ